MLIMDQYQWHPYRKMVYKNISMLCLQVGKAVEPGDNPLIWYEEFNRFFNVPHIQIR
jgi:hypothetical protein